MNFPNDTNMLMNLMRNNPQIKNIMDMINNSDMTPRELFYKKAEEMGVNPDDVLKILQGFNIK